MSWSRLPTLLMPIPGVLLLLAGIYASGGVHTTCRRTEGRVDCHMQTLRIFELVPVASQDAHDVVKAHVFTSTSGSGPSSRNGGRSSSNNTVVLETRGGETVDAYGATAQGSHVFELQGFIDHPEQGSSLHVFSGNWPFGRIAMVFGAVWTFAARFVIVHSRDVA